MSLTDSTSTHVEMPLRGRTHQGRLSFLQGEAEKRHGIEAEICDVRNEELTWFFALTSAPALISESTIAECRLTQAQISAELP
jgi:hypothetical protein